MEIQWSLVFFTVLTGAGGWMLACIAANELANKPKAIDKTAVVVAAIIACLGGLASVTHLSHPENMLAALSHPTSGIFTEAVLTGLMAASAIVYFVLAVKESSAAARKAFALFGALFGILLSFMAGASYMMSSQLTWNTMFLPIGYACTAMPLGIAIYIALAVSLKEKGVDFQAKALVVGGLLALIASLAYGAVSGTISTQAPLLVGASALVGGVLPAACGIAIVKKPEMALVASVVAAVGALAGTTAYRCAMWLVADMVNNFFGML